ncbi:MAG: DUF6600 domain-containing protein [Verrucomicrobiota bacterium]
MKPSFLLFARTGVLGVALTALTGCPEAAESLQVPLITATEAEADPKAKTAPAPAAPSTVTAVAVTEAAPGEIKQQLAPAIPNLSPGLAEIIRLAQAKVGEDVLLAYIARSTVAYNPTTEEIIYLHDLGVSDKVVAEIVKRSPQPAALMAEQKPVVQEPLNIPAVPAANAPMAPAGPVLTPLVSTNPGPATVVTQPVIVQQPVIIQQPIVIQQAPEEVRYFYTSLAPYGSWVEVDGYGWCWQPTVAVTYTDWRPYHQGGRWLYTDSGWYWQSDYSWGWAPFHYGRWFNHPRRGWCWTPDRVWGPAWVSWRTSSSYCGWAPLPPAARYRHGFGLSYYDRHVGISFEFGLSARDYTFVGHDHFYSHNPYRHCLPTTQVTKVYNQTVVNNVIVQGNNNTVVINQGGAPVTQISKAARMEVQKVNVMDMPAAQRSGVAPDRLVRDGNTLAVYRPAGPGSSNLSRSSQEPVKPTMTTGTSNVRPGGGSMPKNHAPANLHPELVNTRPSAPSTALQRYEAPKNTSELPVLSRPQSGVVQGPGGALRPSGMPTQPAGTGTDRALTPQQPVQPAAPAAGRGMVYTPPSKRPEVTKPLTAPRPVSGPVVTPSAPQPVSGPTVSLTQPKPVYGAPATPGAGRPVQPATPEQARLTPQTPVSSYQPPPTAALRSEPSRPSGTIIAKPGGYTARPSVQPSYPTYGTSSGNGISSPQTTQLPRAQELPRNSEPSRPVESPRTTVQPSRPTQSYPSPTYSQPAPSYSAPAQPQRPATVAPSRSYESPRPSPSYSAPAPRPSPSYSAPAAPAPRSVAPQSVSPAPSRPSGGSSISANNGRPSAAPVTPGGNENRRPGNR